MRKSTVRATSAVAAALVVLTACGTNKNEAAPTSGNCDTSKGELVVGVVVPTSGDLSAMGLGIVNSTQLAVDQANEKCAVKGYRLVVEDEDDQAIAQIGGQAAEKLASLENIVGVIGTLNSSVAQSVQPILAQKQIAQLSPANTATPLTRGENYANAPERPFKTFFRLCARDDNQAPFGADYLIKTKGKSRIAVVTDGKTYGEGLSAEFVKRAGELGAQIVAREKVGEKDTDFTGVVGKIRSAKPDAVYYGGEYPQAGPLSKQMKNSGLNVPLMGGDGIFDDKFIDLGGADGDLATMVGAPSEKLDSAQRFIEDYKANGFKDEYGAYGAFAYDATNILIKSLGTVVADGEWSADLRGSLLEAIGRHKGNGATGELGFDMYGDAVNKLLTVVEVKADQWEPIKTGQLED